MATELVVIDATKYAILDPTQDVGATVKANFGGEDISPFDLTRIKCPSGGGTTWEVPALSGAVAEKAIEGVIIHVGRRRVYWESDDTNGSPPDCSSIDGCKGVGNPGGPCDLCPMAEYETAKGGTGRGQACKETRLLFMVREQDRIPVVISVPPASLKAWKKYTVLLSSAGSPVWAVVTRLTLDKAANKDGKAYSQVNFAVAGELPRDSIDAMRKYAQSISGLFQTVTGD